MVYNQSVDTSDLNEDLLKMLQRIKKTTLYSPSNHPVLPDEEPIYDIGVDSADDIRQLKELDYQKVIQIQTPGIKGFGIPSKLPRSLAITINKNFSKTYRQLQSLVSKPEDKQIVVRLNMKGRKMLLETPGTDYHIYTFKPDSEPSKIFGYLMNNADTRLKFSTVKLEANSPDYKYSPSEMARKAGFNKNKLLKDYFMPVRTKAEILLRKSIEVNQNELAELTKNLSPIKPQ